MSWKMLFEVGSEWERLEEEREVEKGCNCILIKIVLWKGNKGCTFNNEPLKNEYYVSKTR